MAPATVRACTYYKSQDNEMFWLLGLKLLLVMLATRSFSSLVLYISKAGKKLIHHDTESCVLSRVFIIVVYVVLY